MLGKPYKDNFSNNDGQSVKNLFENLAKFQEKSVRYHYDLSDVIYKDEYIQKLYFFDNPFYHICRESSDELIDELNTLMNRIIYLHNSYGDNKSQEEYVKAINFALNTVTSLNLISTKEYDKLSENDQRLYEFILYKRITSILITVIKEINTMSKEELYEILNAYATHSKKDISFLSNNASCLSNLLLLILFGKKCNFEGDYLIFNLDENNLDNDKLKVLLHKKQNFNVLLAFLVNRLREECQDSINEEKIPIEFLSMGLIAPMPVPQYVKYKK